MELSYNQQCDADRISRISLKNGDYPVKHPVSYPFTAPNVQNDAGQPLDVAPEEARSRAETSHVIPPSQSLRDALNSDLDVWDGVAAVEAEMVSAISSKNRAHELVAKKHAEERYEGARKQLVNALLKAGIDADEAIEAILAWEAGIHRVRSPQETESNATWVMRSANAREARAMPDIVLPSSIYEKFLNKQGDKEAALLMEKRVSKLIRNGYPEADISTEVAQLSTLISNAVREHLNHDKKEGDEGYLASADGIVRSGIDIWVDAVRDSHRRVLTAFAPM